MFGKGVLATKPPLVAGDRRSKTSQLELQNHHAIDLLIAPARGRLMKNRIRCEDARQFAAAIEAEIKSVERANAARIDYLRTSPAASTVRYVTSSSWAVSDRRCSARSMRRYVVPRSVSMAVCESFDPKPA